MHYHCLSPERVASGLRVAPNKICDSITAFLNLLAFVYEPGENWKVGVRGLAQRSRAEILAQASAHRISQICPCLQEILGPWLITVSRVVPSLPPIMTIRFGYE
jgi:hypothetical protein